MEMKRLINKTTGVVLVVDDETAAALGTANFQEVAEGVTSLKGKRRTTVKRTPATVTPEDDETHEDTDESPDQQDEAPAEPEDTSADDLPEDADDVDEDQLDEAERLLAEKNAAAETAEEPAEAPKRSRSRSAKA